jgi:Fuc2NAc and GlcNAc transferase
MTLIPILCAALALAVSAATSGLVAWAGPVDRPRERGAHVSPTPTAGGLGIVAGAAAGLIAYAALGGGGSKIAACFGFAALMGLIGALDDLRDIGARAKLLIQLAMFLGFALFVARIEAWPLAAGLVLPFGAVGGVIGTVLWLVVATNAVNFMDGANGLAAGSLVIIFSAFAAAAFSQGAAGLGVSALVGGAAGAGFLPWNFPRARLFQGDAGALFSSFLLAALAVVGAGERGSGPVFLLFAPLALLPFLTDTLLTLLRRARSGRRLLDAHREHLYQRWFIGHGRLHGAVSLRVWTLIALCCAAAFALKDAPPGVQTAGFGVGVVVLALAWGWTSRRHP